MGLGVRIATDLRLPRQRFRPDEKPDDRPRPSGSPTGEYGVTLGSPNREPCLRAGAGICAHGVRVAPYVLQRAGRKDRDVGDGDRQDLCKICLVARGTPRLLPRERDRVPRPLRGERVDV